MLLPHLLNIKRNDTVLEIGPGAYPYWRSDCLVDKYTENSSEPPTQFGGAGIKTAGKPIYQIVNNRLPFKDNSFDYIICSHVLEHVPVNDLPQLISEIQRVAPKAYIEFPRFIYDYFYNLEVHLNLMDIVDGTIICLTKEKTQLHQNRRFADYAFSLRNQQIFPVEYLNFYAIAVGNEFCGKIPFQICDSEEMFFDIVQKNKNRIPDCKRRMKLLTIANHFKWKTIKQFAARKIYQSGIFRDKTDFQNKLIDLETKHEKHKRENQ